MQTSLTVNVFFTLFPKALRLGYIHKEREIPKAVQEDFCHEGWISLYTQWTMARPLLKRMPCNISTPDLILTCCVIVMVFILSQVPDQSSQQLFQSDLLF